MTEFEEHSREWDSIQALRKWNDYNRPFRDEWEELNGLIQDVESEIEGFRCFMQSERETTNKVKVLRVTVLREMRGWSKAELARRAGINASSMSRIELGYEQAFPKRALKIARALGFADDPSYLFESCESDNCEFIEQYGYCDKCKHLKGKYPLNENGANKSRARAYRKRQARRNA